MRPWCYGWNCLLLILFTHEVTTLSQEWRSMLRLNQNSMTALHHMIQSIKGLSSFPKAKRNWGKWSRFFTFNGELANFVHDRELVSFDPWHVTLSPLILQSKNVFDLRGITAKIVHVSHTHYNFIYHAQHKAHALLRFIIQISYTVRIPIFRLVDLYHVALGYDETTSLTSLSWCNSRCVNSIHHCHYTMASADSKFDDFCLQCIQFE